MKDYVEHRLKVAGYEGPPMFTAEALDRIAEFTEGIPRNINNFCFNALSLACALRQRTVDLAIGEEVISDLDITKHLAEVNAAPTQTVASESDPPARLAEPLLMPERKPVASVGTRASMRSPDDAPTPAEAQAYMEEITRRLRGLSKPEHARTRGSGQD